MKILSVLCVILFVFNANAEEKTYRVVPNVDSSAGASFLIGYTLGTHNGVANEMSGTVKLDQSPFLITNAEIKVPIANINSFNDKRNCHLREALGLNYETSAYPETQVCTSDNLTPVTGVDSIVYPEVTFKLNTLMNSLPNDVLMTGVPKNIIANGTLSLHGITKAIQIPLTLTLSPTSPDTIYVQGSFDVNITDYGVIVRKVLFVSVKDVASVNLNITLKQI